MSRYENQAILTKVPINNKGSKFEYVPVWFKKKKELGQGGFGAVYEVDLFTDKHKTIPWPVIGEFAVKTCRDLQSKQSMTREIGIYEHLVQATDIQHVLTYYGKGCGVILLQKFGISLFDHVQQKGALSLLKVKILMIYLLRTIKYLHEKKIIIHDLKPQNILIDGDSPNDIKLSICDFGSAMKKKRKARKKRNENDDDDDAKQHDKENDVYHTRRNACFDGKEKLDPDIAFTLKYKAPELWEAEAEYDIECDMFAAGLVLRFMLVGKEPNWEGNKYKWDAKKVTQSTHLRPALPQNIPPYISKFINVFLTINPQNRITATEALELEEKKDHNYDDINLTEKNSRSNRFLYTFHVDLSPLINFKQNIKHNVNYYCKFLLFISRIFIKMNKEYEIMKRILPKYKRSGSKTNTYIFRRSTLVQTLYAIEHNMTCILLTYSGQTVCTIHGGHCDYAPNSYSTTKKAHWASNDVATDLGGIGIQIPCMMACGKLFGYHSVGKNKRDIHDSCSKNKDIIPKCNGELRKERLKQWLDFPLTEGKKTDQYDKELHCIVELKKKWKCAEWDFEEQKIDHEEQNINNKVVNYQMYRTQSKQIINDIACDDHPTELQKTTFEDRNKCNKCNETDFVNQSIAYSCSECDDIIVCLECKKEYYS